MSSEPSKSTVEAAPATFSLATLLLVVTCFSLACAGYRIAGPRDGLLAAFTLVAIFLTFWFAIRRRAGLGWTIFGLLVAVWFVDALSPHVGSGPVSPRSECSNNLHQIGLALESYRQMHGTFPPAYVADKSGKPLYSWRVLLLPFMDFGPLYQAFQLDKPWDSGANAKPSAAQLTAYHCPSDPGPLSTTSYVAIVGPSTAWPGVQGRTLSAFKDPSKTILVVEISNSGIHWTEPRDLYVGQMTAGVNSQTGQGISSGHKGGVFAVFADGHIEFIPVDIDSKKLTKMFDVDPTRSVEP